MILRQYNWVDEEDHRVPDPWWFKVLGFAAVALSAGVAVGLGIVVAWLVA
jgi:hypothetical protein